VCTHTVYIYVYIYIRTYIYIYVHTYINTHRSSSEDLNAFRVTAALSSRKKILMEFVAVVYKHRFPTIFFV
jgi:hypothetical protein